MENEKVKIVSDGIHTDVYINGKKVEGLKRVSFEHGYNLEPRLSIDVVPYKVNFTDE